MKLKILGIIAGSTMLGLGSTDASADTDIYVGLDFGYPAAVVVERYPVYYERPTVYYHESYDDPRYDVRYYARERHGGDGHRGHYRSKHKHRRHHH